MTDDKDLVQKQVLDNLMTGLYTYSHTEFSVFQLAVIFVDVLIFVGN